MAKEKIRLPYEYTPRPYQADNVWYPFDAGKKRIVAIWHRRAGKDKDSLNLMARAMVQRVGVYYYVLPTYAQGRKIIWEGIDGQGFKFLDHIPEKLRKRQNNQDMVIELKNGSIFRVLGSDNIDTVVGTNPVGMVFSEFSLHDPRAWDLFRPVLRENGGWALFNGTPRGRNHAYRLLKGAQKLMVNSESEWYASLLTIDDTGVLTAKDIDEERESGMEEDLIQQEFYCSFSVGQKGAYYAQKIELARQQGRVGQVPFDPTVLVNTAWDLGKGDMLSIWFAQFMRSAINLPLYYENNTEDIPYYVGKLKEFKRQYGIEFDYHYVPHDGGHQKLGMSEGSIAEQLQTQMDLFDIGGTVVVVPRRGTDAGINKVRQFLPRMYFDETGCARGLDGLENYTKKWDDKAKTFLAVPKHDWASHPSDALRTLAMSDAPELDYSGETLLVHPVTGEPLSTERFETAGDQTDSGFNLFGG